MLGAAAVVDVGGRCYIERRHEITTVCDRQPWAVPKLHASLCHCEGLGHDTMAVAPADSDNGHDSEGQVATQCRAVIHVACLLNINNEWS